MHKYIFLLLALTVCGFSYELDDLTGTPIEECINCICFARTGSWDINVCGRRFMTLAYWRTAGSLTTSTDSRPVFAWRSCKADRNCILNTIKRFTESFGQLDCNSDGEFNCQDRFSIQGWRGLCVNRRVAPVFFNRFHTCLPRVIEPEGGDNLIGETITQDVKLVVKQTVNTGTGKAKQTVALLANQNS